MAELLQVMDGELSDQITAVHTRLNADSDLGLFVNDFVPDPESEEADFTEPSFGEYARVALDGDWTTPARDVAGQWTTQTEIYEFQPPTAGDPVTVYGWFVVSGGGVVFAVRLETPVVLSVGGDPYPLRVFYSQYSGVVHCTRACS